MKNAKVEQFEHANQFLIITDEEYILQSYDSTVAKIKRDTHNLTLGYDFDYSHTTLRHVYKFIYRYGGYIIADELQKAKNKKQFLLKQIKQGFINYYDLNE